MIIVSFGWTWPAFVAQHKTVTRRNWKPEYAARFKANTWFLAYDRSPRVKGQRIGIGKLIAAPTYEPLDSMPDSDYAAEGFAYLHAHPRLLPDNANGAWSADNCAREAFEQWRMSGGSTWVVRFTIAQVFPEAAARLEALLKDRSK